MDSNTRNIRKLPVAVADIVNLQFPDVPCVTVHVLDCLLPSCMLLMVFSESWFPIEQPPLFTVSVKEASMLPPAVTSAAVVKELLIAALETEFDTVTTILIMLTFLLLST